MNEPAPQSKQLTPVGELCTGLNRIEGQLEKALPKGVTKDKFMRTALQGIQTHRDKDKLASADRSSFYLAVQKAASDGLLLDGREAALVVFSNSVSYMPMVQGLIKLARNSGDIKNIEAAVVHRHDRFTYIMGEDSSPKHEADWFADDRGEPIGVWAVITLSSGEKIPTMLSKSKVMRVAAKSKNAYQYDPTKGDAWEEWWKKTAVKNVLKYAPRSTELDRALQEDEEPIDVTPPQENVVAIEPTRKKKAVDVVSEASKKDGNDADSQAKNPPPETIDGSFEEVPI